MKKLFLSFVIALATLTSASAQNVTVKEPEFAEETLLLTSDSEGIKLSRENGTVKTKAGASLYLTGIGKVKTRLTLKGTKSTSKGVGGSTTRLIVKAKDNNTDPNSFISIFKFEVTKKNADTNLQKQGLCQRQKATILQVLNTKRRNTVKVHTILLWKILLQVSMALL